MHSVLLCIQKSGLDGPVEVKWKETCDAIQQIADSIPGSEVLSPGTIYIPLVVGFQSVRRILSSLDKYSPEYRLLFFDKPPQWVHSDPPPPPRG